MDLISRDDAIKALRKLNLSWHTEDPEENREYFVTWQASLNGHTFRKIGILEWDYDHWLIEDWMRESYEDISVVAWMHLPEEYVEDWK